VTTPSTGQQSPLSARVVPTPATWNDVEKAGALRDGDALALAYATIEFSGMAALLTDLTVKPRGRKQRGLTVVDVLAGCIALSLRGKAPQFRAIAELLHKDMPAGQRLARGITRPWPTASTATTEARRMKRAAEEAVRRRFESLVMALDPYAGPRNHRMSIADLIEVAQQRAAEDPDGALAAAKRQRLLLLMNGLVQGTLDVVPSDLLGQMGSAFAIDGTFTSTWAATPKGHKSFSSALEAARAVESTTMSPEQAEAAILKKVDRAADAIIAADPEAGPYVRTNADGSNEYKGFGYEAHLAVVTDADGQTGQTSFPSLVVGLSIDTPGFRPGPNAIEIAKSVKNWSADRTVDFRMGIFDALYPGLGMHDFHRPLRELGVMPIYRLREKQLGASGVTFEGASLVEGSWYCSEMPARLVDASKDRVADKISEAEYQKRLDDRGRWQMYRVSGEDVLDEDGNVRDHRHECPSSRRGRTVTCARDTSGVARTDGKSGLPLIPLPVKALPAAEDGSASRGPKACAQRTFQIPASMGVGIEQAHPYMSPEWRAINNRSRSANEGKNGSVKDPTAERIGTKGVRRVNGLAANGILLACQIAASNLRATGNFLQASELGADGRLIRRYPSRGQRSVATPRTSGSGASRSPAARRPSTPDNRRAPSARVRG